MDSFLLITYLAKFSQRTLFIIHNESENYMRTILQADPKFFLNLTIFWLFFSIFLVVKKVYNRQKNL